MQEISPENLAFNTEYYLECFTDDDDDNRIPLEPRYKMIAKFEKMETSIFTDCKFPSFTHFRKLQHKNDLDTGYRVTLSMFWKFYEISEPKIQKNMERRSYNKVLQQITNDEYFTTEFI